MNRKEYIAHLKSYNNELYEEIKILKRFKDYLEEQVEIYEEDILNKEKEIEQNNAELDDLEGNVWGKDQYSYNDYLHDTIPPEFL